ncbi:uncharacterized protein KIAA1614 homolog [Nothoprocta perdicaria]|uniref:uncharacterized protein KIAA1614 homolog n=1 Tax=Nothoprocta perdicaria TaxID=30464 RepID=UPI000E1B8B22|nr:uncharacterized protein KIAA1614 homolog [Nothoprocta perdicaria]
MEREAAAEVRRAPRPPRQRSRATAEGPEAAAHAGDTAPAGGPHAVLEGKVKALKEKRGAARPRLRRAKPGLEAAEPQAQVRTYLTDGLLDGTTGAAVALHPAPASTGRDNTGGPWRLPGDGGGTSGLSLAQRVERNRQLLQEVLALAATGPPLSNADRDSGVSLPDADGCRAFVAGPELALSPRHEQAKQLLQRARMKARTNPLRASHDILPPACPALREPSGTPAPEPKPQDGEAPASGSLSDSSSGESSGGARRVRGPSPSRVRFEDESARDAEVRYLERLQLRHRRALGSVLSPLGRGLSLSQPEPAARGSEGEWQSRGTAGQVASPGKVPSARGTCKACGSFLGASASSSDAGSREKHPAEREEGSAPLPEPKARTLGPRGSPLWILPSRQRIHTERIKETYIGDVTYVDDVDSALESTDTSDGCRTDSEEGGPRGPRPRAHGHPRPRGHNAPVAGKSEQERHGANGRGDVRGLSGSAEPKASVNGPEVPSLRAAPLGSTGGREAGVGPHKAPSLQVGLEPSAAGVPGRGRSPAPCRKAGGPRGPSPEPAAPVERPSPCRAGHLPDGPLGTLSTNNCNNTQGRALAGGLRAGATAAGASLQPAAEKPLAQEQQRPKGSSAGSTTPEAPSSRKGGSAAASGLRKLLCSLSQGTKQRLGRFRCYSMEQLPGPGPAPPGPAPPSPAPPAMQKSPSLQSLHMVSPLRQPRRAASVQSLQSLLAKAPRASAYLVPKPGDSSKGGPAPGRSLSLEDIGAPDLPRAVGRVVEVFPDGTSQLELRRPPDGTFGFRLASSHGRPDTGVYVQEMADAGTAKLYAGLLAVGDEILQVNGAAVSGLAPVQLHELLLRADTLSLRVLRQRPPRR